MQNKKGAIAATTTWIVATIIILFVVIFFIYASYILSKEKSLNWDSGDYDLSTGSSSLESKQNLAAILNTNINGREVRDYIEKGETDSIKSDLNLLLERLSDKEEWKMYIYDGDKTIKIGGEGGIGSTKVSTVYVGDKKVELASNLIG